jgi:hypothetical protein
MKKFTGLITVTRADVLFLLFIFGVFLLVSATDKPTINCEPVEVKKL